MEELRKFKHRVYVALSRAGQAHRVRFRRLLVTRHGFLVGRTLHGVISEICLLLSDHLRGLNVYAMTDVDEKLPITVSSYNGRLFCLLASFVLLVHLTNPMDDLDFVTSV